MKNILKNFGDTLEKNIPGFIAISILDINKGINHYSKTNKNTQYDIDLDSNYTLEMVRAKLNALNKLNNNQILEDITITLSSQLHIINVSDDHNFLYYLVVDANQANLTMTKALLTKYKKELTQN